MKNRVICGTIIFLILSAIANLLPEGVAFADQASGKIDRVRQDFNAAFNAGDAKSLAQLIDRDGVWMPPGEPAIVGKNNVEARYAAYFEKIRSTFELKPGEVHLCGKWAFLSGAFSRVDTAKADGAIKQVAGHYLFILKKQPNGSWKIARDIWNEGVKP
ncbi:MAG: DUF4440 domain-containing protein [Syntrophales bacterium]|nr:DUF4440 domain-containing protein [Syntrophales bacterium]